MLIPTMNLTVLRLLSSVGMALIPILRQAQDKKRMDSVSLFKTESCSVGILGRIRTAFQVGVVVYLRIAIRVY